MHVPLTRHRNPNHVNEAYCKNHGHTTYRPKGPDADEGLQILHLDLTDTAFGDTRYWLCLRCLNFVPVEPTLEGPAHAVPEVIRGRELKERTTMRVMAGDRTVRTILLALAAIALWLLHRDQATVQTLVAHYLPMFNSAALQLHFNLESSAIETWITKVLMIKQHAYIITLFAVTGYAVVQAIEAVGLWTGSRIGEYWSCFWTAAFLPLEVWELLKHASYLKGIALAINLVIVVWLLYKKRLFGLRGGGKALRESYHTPSPLDALQSAHVSA